MSSPVTRKVQYQPEQFLLAVMLLPPACLGETSVTAGSASESLFDDDEYYAWLYGGEEDEITGEELALANLLILWDYKRIPLLSVSAGHHPSFYANQSPPVCPVCQSAELSVTNIFIISRIHIGFNSSCLQAL